MLWRGRRESDNIEDQRSAGVKTVGGGALLVGALVVYLMGGNPLLFLLDNLSRVGPVDSGAPAADARDDDRKRFASVVLADTEDVWTRVFAGQGRRYRAPHMVLYRGLVDSACGRAGRATGPFYCPRDERVYLDLSFFGDLATKLDAPGEFAGAYVIAHEIGHHVQNQLDAHFAPSVRIELQADCLAGVWAKQDQRLKNVLEDGDLEQAIGAAAAVGDDRLQRRAGGEVVPDSFTHGSSAQRVDAFRRGFARGDLNDCGSF